MASAKTRIARKLAIGEFWQFTIKSSGQIAANLAELLPDNIEVVDQPFAAGGDLLALWYGRNDRFVSLDQRLVVRLETIPKLRLVSMRRS